MNALVRQSSSHFVIWGRGGGPHCKSASAFLYSRFFNHAASQRQYGYFSPGSIRIDSLQSEIVLSWSPLANQTLPREL